MKFVGYLLASAMLIVTATSSHAINIVVDYSFDTNNFFDTQQKRDAMQAAADRFSGIITSNLLAVSPSGTGSGTSAGWRVGFTHPGTGASYQLSTAANAGSDPIMGGSSSPANEYGFAGLNANEWTLFAGGRALGGPAGQGGTGTGTNFTPTFEDMNGPMHRGLISETPGTTTNTVNDLPAWGGAITFDTATSWHFDLGTSSPAGVTDFYSIALHEVGHALGLASGWNQWQQYNLNMGDFNGAEALAAYNADNGTSLTALDLVGGGNPHWEDGSYESIIFDQANPNYVGTVGAGNLQDLLMEPTANFIFPTLRRFELTNVDVAALRDIGWTTVPEPSTALLLVGSLLLLSRRRAA